MIDKDKERARRRRYYLAHQAERLAYGRKYYNKHKDDETFKEKNNARVRAYYNSHIELCRDRAKSAYKRKKR